MTNTHNQSVSEDQYERFSSQWEELVPNEIDIWVKFYKFWLAADVPLIVLRYEDLICHREVSLGRLFRFLSGSKTLANTVYEERLQRVLNVQPFVCVRSIFTTDLTSSQGGKDGVYKPRLGKIFASSKHFSEAQMEYINSVAAAELKLFGYVPFAVVDFE